MIIAKKKVMSKVLAAALGAAGALTVANNASADTQVQVQSGDTVWGFAQQYSTTIDSISTTNQLADPNVIFVGQQLVIPTSAISTASAAATVAVPTATDNATASQAAEQTTTPAQATTIVAAASASAVSETNAYNVADQAQPQTVASTTDNSAVQTSAAAQTSTAQVSTVAYNVNTNHSTTGYSNARITLAATPSNTTATPSTAAVSTVATSSTTAQSTAAVSATPATQAAAGQGNGSTSSAVATAQSMVGVPYVWGGNTPSGFDCSGLVQYSYGLGSNYRTTYQQTNLGAHKYDVQNAQNGDLYFWGTDSAPYHVAIAKGNGQYIQAPAPGQNVQQGNIKYYTPSYYISMN